MISRRRQKVASFCVGLVLSQCGILSLVNGSTMAAAGPNGAIPAREHPDFGLGRTSMPRVDSSALNRMDQISTLATSDTASRSSNAIQFESKTPHPPSKRPPPMHPPPPPLDSRIRQNLNLDQNPPHRQQGQTQAGQDHSDAVLNRFHTSDQASAVSKNRLPPPPPPKRPPNTLTSNRAPVLEEESYAREGADNRRAIKAIHSTQRDPFNQNNNDKRQTHPPIPLRPQPPLHKTIVSQTQQEQYLRSNDTNNTLLSSSLPPLLKRFPQPPPPLRPTLEAATALFESFNEIQDASTTKVDRDSLSLDNEEDRAGQDLEVNNVLQDSFVKPTFPVPFLESTKKEHSSENSIQELVPATSSRLPPRHIEIANKEIANGKVEAVQPVKGVSDGGTAHTYSNQLLDFEGATVHRDEATNTTPNPESQVRLTDHTPPADSRVTDNVAYLPSSQAGLESDNNWLVQQESKRVEAQVPRDKLVVNNDMTIRSKAVVPPSRHQSQTTMNQRQSPRPRPTAGSQRPPLVRTHAQRPPQLLHQPAWKRFLQKIERGLDGLDEAVSGGAQKLFSATVAAVPSTIRGTLPPLADKTKTMEEIDKFSSSPRDSPSRTATKRSKASDPPPQLDLSRFQKTLPTSKQNQPQTAFATKSDSAGLPDATKQLLAGEKPDESIALSANPYGIIFQRSMARQVPESNKENTISATAGRYHVNATLSGKSTARIMSPTGGASQPQSGNRPPLQAGQKSGFAAAAKSGSPQMRQEPNPFLQQQTSQQQTSTIPQTPVVGSGNLRSFDGQGLSNANVRPPPRTSSQPLNAPRRPRYDDDDDGDDDDYPKSWLSRLAKALPPIPRIRPPQINPFRRRGSLKYYSSAALDAWKADDDDEDAGKGLWGLFRRGKFSSPNRLSSGLERASHPVKKLAPPLADLSERCKSGRPADSLLLLDSDLKSCRLIGRSKAVFDLVSLAFILVGIKQLHIFRNLAFPRSIEDFLSSTLPVLINKTPELIESWMPFAFVGFILAAATRSLLFDRHLQSLREKVEAKVRDDSQYGLLFLRLVPCISYCRKMPERMMLASRAQIMAQVDVARLKFFISFILISLVVMTVSGLGPLIHATWAPIEQLLRLPAFRSWPPEWGALGDEIVKVVKDLGLTLGSTFSEGIHGIGKNPLVYAYRTSVFAALAAVTLIPRIERRQHSGKNVRSDMDDGGEDEAYESHAKFTEQVSNLGVSGATRLALSADSGGVDSILERWTMTIPHNVGVSRTTSFRSLCRLSMYRLLSGGLLVSPLLFYNSIRMTPFGSANNALLQWDALLDVAAVLLYSQRLVWDSLSATVVASDLKMIVYSFVASLNAAIAEKIKATQPSSVSFQLPAAVSPTAGLTVKDLWAAHTNRRAWAVRGASLTCWSGETLLVIGDDGSGKTRLLTVLAEAIIAPPQRSLSASRVRGSITFGGLDLMKWDRAQLKRRLGLFLNDVRTIADAAQALSGLTLEEILEPSVNGQHLDATHSPGSSERLALMLALRITGLYSSLLPRLPSKLSAVVTANEEDLVPSLLRPRYHVLSPAEWSKLLITRILAQSIFNNENSAGTNDHIANCLMGSLLLLDDVTAQLSEIEEALLWRDLRQTGAAIIVTSNRWASGRFADKIAVMKDGAIVETGTHTELLNRGPQQSVYAAKWFAMTAQ